jgi:hypothetical protein
VTNNSNGSIRGPHIEPLRSIPPIANQTSNSNAQLATNTSKPIDRDSTIQQNQSSIDYENVQWKDLNHTKFYALMPVGLIITRAITYPAQLVKTRLQAAVVTPTHQHTTHQTAQPTASQSQASTATKNSASAIKQPSAASAADRRPPVNTVATATTSANKVAPPVIYKNTFDAFRTIRRTEGLRAFYRGFPLSLLSVVVGPFYISVSQLIE